MSISSILKSLLICVALKSLTGAAFGQAGTLDTSFTDPNVSDGSVAGVVVDNSGKMIIGGNFTTVGGATHNHLARLNADGTVDASFTTAVDGTVTTLGLQTDGKVLFGGNFSHVNGMVRHNLARLNADGTLDTDYDPNASGITFALTIQPDGKPLLTGQFFAMGGVAVDGFTRLNPTGVVDGTFTSGQVLTQAQAMAIQNDGRILTVARNQTTVERLEATGVRDTTFNTGSTCKAEACVAVQADGKILALDATDMFNVYLRRYNADGTLDPTFSMGVVKNSGTNAYIYSVYLQADGQIIIGGVFTTVGGTTCNGIARLSSTGVLDTTFNPNINGTAYVMGSPNGKLMVVGFFTTAGGMPRHSVARLNMGSGTQSLSVPDVGRIVLMRSGALAEFQDVIFELSTDNGTSWSALGVASRISGGWTLTGLSLPRNGMVRARGRMVGSAGGSCSTLADFAQSYTLPDSGTLTLNPTPPVAAATKLTAQFTGWLDSPGLLPLRYEVLVDGVSQGSPTTSPAVAFTAPSADGQHTLTGHIYDSVGAMTSVSQTFNIDATPPQLLSVHFVSSNANSQWAAPGDKATLTIQASEPIAKPSVLIGGTTVNAVAKGGNSWQAILSVTVNTAEGRIPLSIQYADLVGNAGVTATQTTDGTSVTVDRTPPVVSLIGPSTLTIEAGSAYAEPGATAQDARAGDVSGTIVISGGVLTGVPGSYPLLYTARDLAGNSGSTTRTVTVVDTTPPAIAAPAGGFLPSTLTAGTAGTANLPNYTSQAVTSDIVGVTSVTQAPRPGTSFPPGVVPITLTARDAAGNASTLSFSVTVVDLTPPTIQAPETGFVPAFIVTGPDATAALPDFTAQAVTGDNVGVQGVTQIPAPGTASLAGTTSVALTARDAAGNTSILVFDLPVHDGTSPKIAAPAIGFTPLEITAGPDGTAALPDYTAQAVTSDNVGVTGVTQDPPPGDPRLFGKTVVTLTAHDAAGNTHPTSFDIIVRLDAPVVQALASIGGGVPGAGVDPRIPAEATFTRIGIPAVADNRALAFHGKWKTATGTENGIFAGDPPALIVKSGDDAPGVIGARFKTLHDPLLAPDGSVAFKADMQGPGINTTNDQGVWMSSDSGLTLVLRKGAQIIGAPPKFRLKSVSGLSLRNGELLASAQLALVGNLVTAANDSVLLRVTPKGATVLTREGHLLDLADGFSPSTIQKITTLVPSVGSPGQGRWQGDGAAIAKVTLADQRSVILGFAADGSVTRTLAVGDGVPNLPATAIWGGLNPPAIAPGGQGSVASGTLYALAIPGLPPVATQQTDFILAFSPNPGAPYSMFAREGSPAPGVRNAVFSTFLDPLVNDAGRVAFSATLGVAGNTEVNNAGIWWGDPDALQLLVRTNSPVPGPDAQPTAAKWSHFISLALPSGPDAGPIFTARVYGAGVTLKNDIGLWAVDSDGQLRQLLRTGDLIDGNAIVGIQCLNAVPSALGASRGFNARGTVAVRLLLARGGQAVVRIDIPEGKTRLTTDLTD